MVRAVAVPTRLDALRRRYLHGALELDEFEDAVAALLASGLEHEPERQVDRADVGVVEPR